MAFGIANGNPISVYALFYANVGHFNHHVGVVRVKSYSEK